MFDTTAVYFLVGLVILLGAALLWPAKRASQAVEVKLLDLETVIERLVATAEQTMPGKTGSEKLAFVLREIERLTTWGQIEKVDTMWLRVLVEAAVFALKQRGQDKVA